MIALAVEPPPAVDAAESLAELIALAEAGDVSAIVARLKARGALTPQPRGTHRKREESGPARTTPRDPRDWLLIELDLPDASKSNIERALHAAGATHDETLTAGALCKWSVAELVGFGVEAAAVEKLRRALAKVRLRLRGDNR